jgi:hypothetical protein
MRTTEYVRWTQNAQADGGVKHLGTHKVSSLRHASRMHRTVILQVVTHQSCWLRTASVNAGREAWACTIPVPDGPAQHTHTHTQGMLPWMEGRRQRQKSGKSHCMAAIAGQRQRNRAAHLSIIFLKGVNVLLTAVGVSAFWVRRFSFSLSSSFTLNSISGAADLRRFSGVCAQNTASVVHVIHLEG